MVWFHCLLVAGPYLRRPLKALVKRASWLTGRLACPLPLPARGPACIVRGPPAMGAALRFNLMTASPFAAPAHTLPKAAQAILALPRVESLEREQDAWCCRLAHGWTTDASGDTIIDTNLKTIRAFVRDAYRMPDAARSEAKRKAAPEASRFASGAIAAEPWGKLQAMTGPGRKTGPSGLPVDAARLLKRFNLDLDSVVTIGVENAKIAKGAGEALPVIHHMMPARSIAAAVYGPEGGSPRDRIESVRALALENGLGGLVQRFNACPWASNGCRDGCLNWAGHGGISSDVAACRSRRTLAWIFNPRAYMVALLWAIARQWQRAQIQGLPLSLRLKGTDDLHYHVQRFHLTAADAAILARRYGLTVAPGNSITLPEALRFALEDRTIRWYEYSKAPVGGSQGLDSLRQAGIDVTASLAADRRDGARAACGAVRAGYRLAIPVAIPKGQPLPFAIRLAPSLSLPGAPGAPGFGRIAPDDRPVRLRVVNGDMTDLRWLDPEGPSEGFDGIAVVLRTKRSRGASKIAEGFSLRPLADQWQALPGGGFANLEVVGG